MFTKPRFTKPKFGFIRIRQQTTIIFCTLFIIVHLLHSGLKVGKNSTIRIYVFKNFFDFNSMCLFLQYILMSHNSKKRVLLTDKSFTKVIRKALHVSFQFSRDVSEKRIAFSSSNFISKSSNFWNIWVTYFQV